MPGIRLPAFSHEGTRGTEIEGYIVSIHIASAPGVLMTTCITAHLMPGRGIEGDRFYALRCLDAASAATTCDVTIVEKALSIHVHVLAAAQYNATCPSSVAGNGPS